MQKILQRKPALLIGKTFSYFLAFTNKSLLVGSPEKIENISKLIPYIIFDQVTSVQNDQSHCKELKKLILKTHLFKQQQQQQTTSWWDYIFLGGKLNDEN